MSDDKIVNSIENLSKDINEVINAKKPSKECELFFKQEDSKKVSWAAFITQSMFLVGVIGAFVTWMLMMPSSANVDTSIKAAIQKTLNKEIIVLQERQREQEKINASWTSLEKEFKEISSSIIGIQKDLEYLKRKK